MFRKWVLLISSLFVLAAASISCSILVPGTNTTAGAVETSVAETMTALTPAASIPAATTAPTAEAHSLPTITPPQAAAPVRVSFVSSSRNLYVWTDGTVAPIQLTTSGDVDQSAISSDGSLIAFTRSVNYANYQLDVINADGTNERTLLSSASFDALPRSADAVASIPYQVVWMPGSHRLSMNVRIEFNGPGLSVAEQLYNFDADSGLMSTLMTVPPSWRFGYSPDGTKLVISRPLGVDLYSSDGTLIRANVVSHAFVNTASEYAWVATAVWQSDSSNFALAIPPVDPFANSPADTLFWKVTRDGTAANLFSTPISFFSPTFNPNLTKTAFSVQVGLPTDNKWALHISNIDGSGDSTIATGYFGQLPVWSPDGNYFIFGNMSGSITQAYLASGGGTPALLPDVASLIEIRWLDNSRYVISSRTPTGYSLLLGTVGSSTGVIFNESAASDSQTISFDVNR